MMITDTSTAVLDSSCLLGTHRLVGILQQPFEKWILPPNVASIAWPAGPDICDFAIKYEYSVGNRNIDIDAILRGDNQTVKVVHQEFDKVKDLISKLRGARLLETPSWEDWPTPAEERSDYLAFQNPLQLNYVTELQNGKETLRISVADFEALSASWYHTYSFTTWRPELVTFFSQKYGPGKLSESQHMIKVLGDLGDLSEKDLEKYIRDLAESSGAITREFGATRTEVALRELYVVGKNVFYGLLGPAGTFTSTLEGFEEERVKIDAEREQLLQDWERVYREFKRALLQTLVISSTDSNRVSIMEALAKFIEKPRPPMDM